MTYSMSTARRLVVASALIAGVVAGAAMAAEHTDAAAAPAQAAEQGSATAAPAKASEHGDATAGAAKAAACVACHGPNGNSGNAEWPVIAGQNASYSRDQIKRIKSGARPNALMQPIVKDMTDQDIADVAAYFARQTPTGNEADPSYWKAGEKLYRSGDAARGIPACSACHGPLGRGNPAAGYPALQAQHSVYTVKQLDGYALDTRYTKDASGQLQAGPNAPIMKVIAARLTAEDRRNLASYIQGIR
jgi:cytochrome c553